MRSDALDLMPVRGAGPPAAPFPHLAAAVPHERLIVLLQPSARRRSTRFDPHRALWSLQLPVRAAVGVAGLSTLLVAFVGFLLAPIVKAWRIVLESAFGWLQLPMRVDSTSVSVWGDWKLPLLEIELAAKAPSWPQWWATLLVTVTITAIALREKAPLPGRYLAMLLTYTLAASLAFFALVPDRFPYTAGRHVGDGLVMVEVLMMAVPLLYGGTYYVFDFSIIQKAGLTVITIAFLAVAAPFQYVVHAWVIDSLSLLWLPPLYLLFGIVLDILAIIALYSWGMSWGASGGPPGARAPRASPDDGRNAGLHAGAFVHRNSAILTTEHAARTDSPGLGAGVHAVPDTFAAGPELGNCTFCGVCRFCSSPTALSGRFCSECASPLHLKPCSCCGTVNECSSEQCAGCGTPFRLPDVRLPVRPCPAQVYRREGIRDAQAPVPLTAIARDDVPNVDDALPLEPTPSSAEMRLPADPLPGVCAAESMQSTMAQNVAKRRVLHRIGTFVAAVMAIGLVGWLALRLPQADIGTSRALTSSSTVDRLDTQATATQPGNAGGRTRSDDAIERAPVGVDSGRAGFDLAGSDREIALGGPPPTPADAHVSSAAVPLAPPVSNAVARRQGPSAAGDAGVEQRMVAAKERMTDAPRRSPVQTAAGQAPTTKRQSAPPCRPNGVVLGPCQ